MKIIAGATYAVAEQSTVYVADINKAVQCIFEKSTGLASLGTLDNPGQDEIRTLYADSMQSKTVIKAVLYSVAKIRSPLSKGGIYRTELWGSKSPLVAAGLTQDEILPALDAALDLGFLRDSLDKPQNVEFTIPLLGESLRYGFDVLWTNLNRELDSIVQERK